MRGFTDISQKRYTEILNENMQSFLDWSFVSAGAYLNITANLSAQDNKNYVKNTYWQAPHADFVWESGITTGSPNYLSGVFIDNVFSPLNSGYVVDYRNGNLLFDSAQTGTLSLSYSSKWVTVLDSTDVPFFQRLSESSYYDGDYYPQDFSPYNSRVKLPAIYVETIRRTNKPYELGGWSRIAKTDVKLHIVAHRKGDLDRIGDILVDVDETAVWLYDANMVESSGAYPFSLSGTLVNQSPYTELSKTSDNGGYRYAKCYIRNPYGENATSLTKDLYMKTVTWETETVLPTY